MKPISEITSIAEYVDQFSLALGDKVAAQCQPLHDPKTGNHPRLVELATKPFPKQAEKITAQVKALSKRRLYIDAGMMGTGKTMQCLSTVHCHANGKPYTCMVICPSHLTKKWVKEVHKFLGKGVRATIIEDWKAFMQIMREPKPTQPTWYIMAQTTAKLGYTKRAAVIRKTRKVYSEVLGWHRATYVCCPSCDTTVMLRGVPADESDVERLLLKCQGMRCKSCGVVWHQDTETCAHCEKPLVKCDEPLYQPKMHKVSPTMVAKVKRFKTDYFVRDEAHLSKGSDSIDGHACATFADCARYRLLLTGTLLAGKSEDIRPLLFRLTPKPFVNLGYGWGDEIPFGTQYGRIQTTIRTTSGGYEKRKSGKGSSKTTARDIKPGIMPQLFPDFISNYTSFLSLTDLATDLPLYTELTKPVQMDEVMLALYKKMETDLVTRFRELYMSDRRSAAKMLGPMLETLMTWPDVPYGRKPVAVDGVVILIPPVMDKTLIYPKERALLEFIKSEKDQGRKCFVFSDRDDTKERLMWVLESHGLKVAHLTTAVAPAKRIDWLEKHAPACDVGLCNPTLVETGMELFGPGFNFPSLYWYSTGYRLNTLRQASRRSWRIGQKMECKTIYSFYDQTAQQKTIALMAAKLVAAEAIEGKFSDGGLADESVDDDIALQVARALADGIEIKMKAQYRPVEAGLSADDRIQILKQRIRAKLNGNMGA